MGYNKQAGKTAAYALHYYITTQRTRLMWFSSPRSSMWGDIPHPWHGFWQAIMTSLVPPWSHISSTLAPNRPHMENALGSGFRRNKKAMAVGLSSVSVLAADSPLFFWMHRHWRAMIQISAPTSGSLLFLSCYLTSIRFVLVEKSVLDCMNINQWFCVLP